MARYELSTDGFGFSVANRLKDAFGCRTSYSKLLLSLNLGHDLSCPFCQANRATVDKCSVLWCRPMRWNFHEQAALIYVASVSWVSSKMCRCWRISYWRIVCKDDNLSTWSLHVCIARKRQTFDFALQLGVLFGCLWTKRTAVQSSAYFQNDLGSLQALYIIISDLSDDYLIMLKMISISHSEIVEIIPGGG